MLYECIRGHIVTLRGCKTGSKVIWLLYVLFFQCLYRGLTFSHSDRMVRYDHLVYSRSFCD